MFIIEKTTGAKLNYKSRAAWKCRKREFLELQRAYTHAKA